MVRTQSAHYDPAASTAGREEKLGKTMSRRTVLAAAVGLAALWAAGPARAAPVSFTVTLTGAQQVPPVTTTGSGTANLTWDPATRVVTWSITYGGLSSAATMAHFHNGGPGKNGPVVIWLTQRGVPPASPFTGSATLTAAQAAQFEAGDWYINLHTTNHPAGEIRGQVIPPKG
jgi:CHRD domain